MQLYRKFRPKKTLKKITKNFTFLPIFSRFTRGKSDQKQPDQQQLMFESPSFLCKNEKKICFQNLVFLRIYFKNFEVLVLVGAK